MRKPSSSALIRRGRPPAQRGSSALIPSSLNRWITSRTVSSSAATRPAIAGTVLPPAEASTTIARRWRIPLLAAFGSPRRTIRSSRCPSSSERRLAFTRSAMHQHRPTGKVCGQGPSLGGVNPWRAEPVTPALAFHGEGPVWDAAVGRLHWVDMLAGDLLSLDAGGGVQRRRLAAE